MTSRALLAILALLALAIPAAWLLQRAVPAESAGAAVAGQDVADVEVDAARAPAPRSVDAPARQAPELPLVEELWALPEAEQGAEVRPGPAPGAERGSGPAIVGRVVRTSGRPEDARVSFVLTARRSSFMSEVATDASGRFRVPMRDGELREARLMALAPGVGRRELVLRDVPAQGLDLGDVVLEPGRDLHLVVRSSDGAPLAGAWARAPQSVFLHSAPSDDQGRAVLLQAPLALRELALGAPLHGEERVAVPRDGCTGEDPLEVELRPLPALLLDVAFDDGSPVKGLAVRLELFEPEPFVDGGRRSARRPQGAGGTSFHVQNVRGAAEPGRPLVDMTCSLPADGRVHVPGLRPVGALDAVVLDGCGREVARARVHPRQLDAREPVRLELPGPPRALAVLVEDARGEPVAEVFVRPLAPGTTGRYTGAEGRAELGPLVGPTLDLHAFKPGFLPRAVERVTLQTHSRPLRIVLVEGLDLRVRAQDGRGRPIPIERVAAALDELALLRSDAPDADGAHVLRGLPPEPARVEVAVGWSSYARVHDPREGDLTLTLEGLGAVRARLGAGFVAPTLVQVVLLDAQDEERFLQRVLRRGEAAELVLFCAVEAGPRRLELRGLENAFAGQVLLRGPAFEVRPGEEAVVDLDARGIPWE